MRDPKAGMGFIATRCGKPVLSVDRHGNWLDGRFHFGLDHAG